jgi:hypothetical protein
MPCSLVSTFQRNLLYLSSGFMKFFSEYWGSSSVEMLTPTCQTTWCHISEDCIIIFTAVNTSSPKKEQLCLNIHLYTPLMEVLHEYIVHRFFSGIRIEISSHFPNSFPSYMYCMLNPRVHIPLANISNFSNISDIVLCDGGL